MLIWPSVFLSHSYMYIYKLVIMFSRTKWFLAACNSFSHHRHGQDKTVLSCLVRVGSVNTIGSKTRRFCLVSTQFPVCNSSVSNISRTTENLETVLSCLQLCSHRRCGRDTTVLSCPCRRCETSYIEHITLVIFAYSNWVSWSDLVLETVHVLQLLKKNVTERLGCGPDDAAPIKVDWICLQVSLDRVSNTPGNPGNLLE